jgi:hypothetical protein
MTMTNEEQLQQSQEELDNIQWAIDVTTNETASDADKEKADKILAASQAAMDKAVESIDDIMDIEDDDAREAAFEKYFAECEAAAIPN